MNASTLKNLIKQILLWISLALTSSFSLVARADLIPDSASVAGVAGHPQLYNLSCEARSAVDWMAFWGVSASEADFLSRLPRSDNPDHGFVGQPNDTWGNIPPRSYGVHAEPVAALLREYGFEAEAHRDLTWDELRAEIAAGRPVIVWVIGQMWSGTPRSYTDQEGHNTIVASFEHTMILTGYDEAYVYVVDAFSGLNLTFGLPAFLQSWSVLGNMAVTGEKSGSVVDEELPGEAGYEGNTYTVQRGDYLVALAERFGTTWQELAARNNIRYPYMIYPGQVLDVPGAADSPEVAPPPEPLPMLEPTPIPVTTPTANSRPLRPEEIRFRLFLPEVCLDCQPGEIVPVVRGRLRQRYR